MIICKEQKKNLPKVDSKRRNSNEELAKKIKQEKEYKTDRPYYEHIRRMKYASENNQYLQYPGWKDEKNKDLSQKKLSEQVSEKRKEWKDFKETPVDRLMRIKRNTRRAQNNCNLK